MSVPIVNVVQYNFDSNPILTEVLSGGMWTGDVPESIGDDPVEMPYAKIELEESANEYAFGTFYIEHGKVSITIFDTSADNVNTIINTFKDEWPQTIDLVIPSGNEDTTFFHIFLLKKSLASEFMKDKDGNQVYSGSLLYEISLTRN